MALRKVSSSRMQIYSDPGKDHPTPKPHPGSYEWWYFDGISDDLKYSFVIIFYQGNPFSSRYMNSLSQNKSRALAEAYPAMSISVYEHNKPIFYSMSEYPADQCLFSTEHVNIRIGNNTLSARRERGSLSCRLTLAETLPSGDTLSADLSFESRDIPVDLLTENVDSGEGPMHSWNLIQPEARVNGQIGVSENGRISRCVPFAGTGYHDHNLGSEPIDRKFADWYWGRFHFDAGTFIFYIMNTASGRVCRAWLIDPVNEKGVMKFDQVSLSEPQLNGFLLSSNRKLEFTNSEAQVYIQLDHSLDSGPFYMRFSAQAVMHSTVQHMIARKQGITEYLRPSRIHSRIFRPLVNMRRRYVGEKPHWVQRSPRLYRWTW
ncbi:MAG: hypothetical protein WD266_13570 [Balneolales bacterium]